MQNNYWSSCLFPLFLSSLSSCTLASYTDQELQNELDILAKRAIARFKFPKISLKYEYDREIADVSLPVVERSTKGYYFSNEVGYREIEVILAWMKVYWLEYQLSKERNYENLYADKDVKAFSSGNLISAIEKAYNTMMATARKVEEDYGRVTANGKPAIGDVNVEI
jgi:hypothetical protein